MLNSSSPEQSVLFSEHKYESQAGKKNIEMAFLPASYKFGPELQPRVILNPPVLIPIQTMTGYMVYLGKLWSYC